MSRDLYLKMFFLEFGLLRKMVRLPRGDPPELYSVTSTVVVISPITIASRSIVTSRGVRTDAEGRS